VAAVAASALVAAAAGAWAIGAFGAFGAGRLLPAAGHPSPTHAALQTGKTPRPEVYELFQQGRFHQRQESPASLARAVEYFEQAIARDPDFALGYAGLASARHDQQVWGTGPREGAADRVRHATLKALALAPDLPEAHLALGVSLFYYDWDWVGSEAAFRRAIQLNPNLSWSHTQYVYLLIALGRFDEALAEAEKAVAIDPLEPNSLCAAGRASFGARRLPEAEAYYRRALALEPGFGLALDMLTDFYLAQRRVPEARETLERLRHIASHRSIAALEMRYALLSGQPDKALRYLKSLEDGAAPIGNWRTAAVLYMLLDDRDHALGALEQSVNARRFPFWAGDADLDPLRGDPRFLRLLERMNLPKDSIALLVQAGPVRLVKAATE
jgi:serine/threonine-protein kinase